MAETSSTQITKEDPSSMFKKLMASLPGLSSSKTTPVSDYDLIFVKPVDASINKTSFKEKDPVI
jgi:hypothetical protein